MSNYAARYRKKPVVIDAVQYLGESKPIIDFLAPEDAGKVLFRRSDAIAVKTRFLLIETLEGQMLAQYGWWIIRGIKGELYPCDPEIFAATYEALEKLIPAEGKVAKSEGYKKLISLIDGWAAEDGDFDERVAPLLDAAMRHHEPSPTPDVREGPYTRARLSITNPSSDFAERAKLAAWLQEQADYMLRDDHAERSEGAAQFHIDYLAKGDTNG